MASLYKQATSHYWWIKSRDPSGKIVRESTGMRWSIPSETRKAREKCALARLKEAQSNPREASNRHLEKWVQKWLDAKYAGSPLTHAAYTDKWKILERFLSERGVRVAEQITRAMSIEYIEARTAGIFGRKPAAKSTAVHDLRILRLICYEAVAREWLPHNPLARSGIKSPDPKEKPEFTMDQIELVSKRLKRFPWDHPMRLAWEIALAQGCRITETSLPLDHVDLKNRTISFKIKRGKLHTTILNPSLIPLFKKLRGAGKTETYPMSRNLSRDFSREFKRIGLKGYSFHSTRVTVVTRLARSGKVSEQQAMRFIGHANSSVHRIYQRLSASDLGSCLEALSDKNNRLS